MPVIVEMANLLVVSRYWEMTETNREGLYTFLNVIYT